MQSPSRSNGGGATQRAEALAALSSAFNPSSGEKTSSPSPNVSTCYEFPLFSKFYILNFLLLLKRNNYIRKFKLFLCTIWYSVAMSLGFITFSCNTKYVILDKCIFKGMPWFVSKLKYYSVLEILILLVVWI